MSAADAGSFDKVAPFYDALARLVFGNAIRESQRAFLECIPRNAKVLIIGGGTGYALVRLKHLHPESEVWYVEPSGKMMARAKKRLAGTSGIHFVEGTLDDITASDFDVMVAHFYFDLFPTEVLSSHIASLSAKMKNEAIWIVSEFARTQNRRHLILLRLMYRFFRCTTRIEAGELPAWRELLAAAGWRRVEGKQFYSGFIESGLYLRGE